MKGISSTGKSKNIARGKSHALACFSLISATFLLLFYFALTGLLTSCGYQQKKNNLPSIKFTISPKYSPTETLSEFDRRKAEKNRKNAKDEDPSDAAGNSDNSGDSSADAADNASGSSDKDGADKEDEEPQSGSPVSNEKDSDGGSDGDSDEIEILDEKDSSDSSASASASGSSETTETTAAGQTGQESATTTSTTGDAAATTNAQAGTETPGSGTDTTSSAANTDASATGANSTGDTAATGANNTTGSGSTGSTDSTGTTDPNSTGNSTTGSGDTSGTSSSAAADTLKPPVPGTSQESPTESKSNSAAGGAADPTSTITVIPRESSPELPEPNDEAAIRLVSDQKNYSKVDLEQVVLKLCNGSSADICFTLEAEVYRYTDEQKFVKVDLPVTFPTTVYTLGSNMDYILNYDLHTLIPGYYRFILKIWTGGPDPIRIPCDFMASR